MPGAVDISFTLVELLAGSRESPDAFLPDIVCLVSDFMKHRDGYIGTPCELAALISSEEKIISDRTVSCLLMQHTEALEDCGIRFEIRHSNGKRTIQLYTTPARDDKEATAPL